MKWKGHGDEVDGWRNISLSIVEKLPNVVGGPGNEAGTVEY